MNDKLEKILLTKDVLEVAVKRHYDDDDKNTITTLIQGTKAQLEGILDKIIEKYHPRFEESDRELLCNDNGLIQIEEKLDDIIVDIFDDYCKSYVASDSYCGEDWEEWAAMSLDTVIETI